jgi:hypothetical protein
MTPSKRLHVLYRACFDMREADLEPMGQLRAMSAACVATINKPYAVPWWMVVGITDEAIKLIEVNHATPKTALSKGIERAHFFDNKERGPAYFDHDQPLTESQLWEVHLKYDRVVLATKPENNIDVFSPITLLPSSMDFKSSFSLNLPKYKWAEVKAYLDSHPETAGKTRAEAEQWRGQD